MKIFAIPPKGNRKFDVFYAVMPNGESVTLRFIGEPKNFKRAPFACTAQFDPDGKDRYKREQYATAEGEVREKIKLNADPEKFTYMNYEAVKREREPELINFLRTLKVGLSKN